jgi:hypothetical protein
MSTTQLYLPLPTPIAGQGGFVTTPWQLYFQNLAAGLSSGITQLTGDVTAGPGNGSQTATIAAGAVTYAKIQNISAASKLLGRGSAAGAGSTEEITLGTGLSMSATTLNSTGGDVVGPGSATADVPALFNGTTGKIIKNSTPTGTGNPVMQTTPTLTTPILGVATATSVNKVAFTAPTTAATFAFPVDNATFTMQGTDTYVGRATTDTLTNKRITKRVTTATDATSVTPNTDNVDMTYQLNTQAGGTLTLNNDTGTPTNGQPWTFKVKCSNVQTLAFDTIYVGGTVALPAATTGGGKIDYFNFVYDSVTPKWDYVSSAVGF